MDPSSSMSLPPSMHLAMAALLGASFMAISAFYIHRRTVDHVLHRLVEVRRGPPRTSSSGAVDADTDDYDDFEEEEYEDGDDRSGFGGEFDADSTHYQGSLTRSVDESLLRSYRISSSMPNVASAADWFPEDPRFGNTAQNRVSSLDNLKFAPLGLPSLRTRSTTGENAQLSSSYKRIASVGRIMTPRSPGRTAFESTEDSDEEGTQLGDDSRIPFYPGTRDSSNNYGLNPNMCNLSGVAFRLDDANSAHQMSGEVSKEGKASGDMNTDGTVDSNSAHAAEKDLAFISSVFPKRNTVNEPINIEEEEVCKMIRECLDLRKQYVYKENLPWKAEPVEADSDPFHFEPVEATPHHFRMEDGVIHVYANKTDTEELFPVASSTTFFTDMHYILKVMSVGNVRSACYHRLRFLEEKFRLHLLLNADREFLAQKGAPHRDFYNIRKVDTHIHHSACMNQKHLLRFIKSKLRKEPDEVVIFRDGKYMTLKEVFESLDLTGYDLNVDLLDVHADKSTFHRFDKFNLKYNPCGQSRLREIFLKQDNLIQGRFLAEVTKQVLTDLEASKYQMAEYRISVYGRKQSEWDQLASWFVNNAIYNKNAVWLIQLPRLYNVYKNMGIVTSFQNILDNVFIPLFEVTIDPNSHPQLHLFLKQVSQFDPSFVLIALLCMFKCRSHKVK
ncbi:AMP deaminase [Arachis hypogaea]|nr:AMP deaminase [Arachis hypogaea]